MRKLNNKGYMLVEIIMAFVLAFGILYFMMDLVIDVKDNNDDLMVETIVRTDQTIITNRLMEYAIEKKDNFDCNNGFEVDGNIIKYGDDVITIVSDYAIVGEEQCSVDEINRTINIKIPIDVKQMNDEDFDIVINYIYDIEVAYAIYSSADKSLIFYKNYDLPSVGSTYNSRSVDAVYTGIEFDKYISKNDIPWYEYREQITKIIVEDEIKPLSTAYWFDDLKNVEYIDVSKLNTSNVKDMSNMFAGTGYNVDEFEIVGLENWDVSNVTSMSNMFANVGYNATTFNIGNIGNWDVSSTVTLFQFLMGAGYSATNWNIGDLSNWDVSNVTNMASVFYKAGYSAITWSIGDLSEWNVSNVTSMGQMFCHAGYNSTTWNIGDLSNWDVSNVTNMRFMFNMAGYSADEFEIVGLENWDVSNVIDMEYMFDSAGYKSTRFKLNLTNWNVSSVTDMARMFYHSGYKSITWNVGDLTSWNTLNVTDMNAMFSSAGYNANYFLELSGWDVSKVTSYGNFNNGVLSKVKSPVWVN